MDKVKLSVIIPHYNSPDRLAVLLDMIPNIEEIKVIVVDDNSTENVNEYNILKKMFSMRNIHFYSNTTGKNSAGTCRNIALEHAEGEWVMFADSDDYFLSDWYTTVSQYFNSDNDIVFFAPTSIQLDTRQEDIRHIDISNKIVAYVDNPNKHNELAIRYCFHEPWSKLIRRSLITDNNLKFEDILVCNDAMFSILSGYYAKKIECSKTKIYCVTRSKGSLTTIKSKYLEDIRLKCRIRRAGFLYAHLTKEELQSIGMDKLGMSVLHDGVKYGMGVIPYIKYMKKYDVPVINAHYLNPFLIFSKTRKIKKEDAKMVDYLERYSVESEKK